MCNIVKGETFVEFAFVLEQKVLEPRITRSDSCFSATTKFSVSFFKMKTVEHLLFTFGHTPEAGNR